MTLVHKILLVEDEKILRDAYSILLGAQSEFEVDIASNGQEALELCGRNHYDVILLDLMMPILDGIGFLEQSHIRETSPRTRIIILSNLSAGEESVKALELGAHRHAVKSDLAPNDVIDVINAELAALLR